MNARRAAADLVVAVLDERRALDEALAATPSFAALEGRDRAFARALATATLRRLGSIDAVLARFLERPLPDTAWHGRAMLRIGAAQLLVLETPPHAAVGETVETANGMREARGFAKLINAVLRKVSREGAEIFAAQADGADLPAWLYARWRASYGDEAAASIARMLREEPPLDLSVKQDAAGWAERLGGALTPTGSVRTSAAGVDSLPGFADGAWWVQDAAAALPAKLLGDVRGRTVADLCAAPGGKTLQLANAGAIVTAVDRAPERLERLRENLARTQLEATVRAADVLKLRTKTPFDAILLDAPCTSTGTLRRHPDVAWLRRPTDIRALAELQTQLLDAAAGMVGTGGTLVYAVCSLEPEEGPGVVADALSSGAWKRSPVGFGEIAGADAFITPDGDLRTLPSQWADSGGLDGFYAARLTRL
ncbi:RsmB/NOP family class I SAM-dependent RNA methyltransferase [Terricaulis sp.]|uniref:RsmB/NOP family class I SAM-dependent RNA methyltransferase n=1 Tax=Terricaulis sp. TaxID=2768686 RepID=UPI003784BF3F